MRLHIFGLALGWFLAAGTTSLSSANAFLPSSHGRLSRLGTISTATDKVLLTPYGGGAMKDPVTPTIPTALQSASAAAVNGDSNEKRIPTMVDSVVSASLLIALDVGFRKLFQALSISFPSSLGGCCALFVAMLVLPFGSGMFSLLNPGAALLAKWLPVFFVPSLITLPLAGSIGPPMEVRRKLVLFSFFLMGV